MDLIAKSGRAFEPGEADALRFAIRDYYGVARDVSRRLIAEETGEALVRDIAEMQVRQRETVATLQRVTGLNDAELANAFTAIRTANDDAFQWSFLIGAVGRMTTKRPSGLRMTAEGDPSLPLVQGSCNACRATRRQWRSMRSITVQFPRP